MTELVHPATGLVLFSHKELASPDTGEVVLASGFAELLVELRVRFGLPMIVTSCCRTPEHNIQVEGHPRSLHLTVPAHEGIDGTAAIDVKVGDATMVRRLIEVALPLGWSIGLAMERLIFDELERIADPEAPARFRRIEQRARRDTGQRHFWRPGRPRPDRAPDLGAALGR